MDYYKILDIDNTATADDIKSAFKKKAMHCHPDKGGNADEFKKVNEAYQILSDPHKRQSYDQYGTAEPPQHQYRSNNFTDAAFDDVLRNFGFNINFGNGFQQQTMRKNKDIKLSYAIDIVDIYKGKTDTIGFRLPTGQEEIVVVKVPPGVREGNMIKFQNQGDNSIAQLPRGDLIVQIVLRPNIDFKINGNDIFTRIKVNIIDLLCGTVQNVSAPDGRNIRLTIPKGTVPNTKFNVPEHGLPILNHHACGNFIIETLCQMPNLTDTDVSRLKSFAEQSKIFD